MITIYINTVIQFQACRELLYFWVAADLAVLLFFLFHFVFFVSESEAVLVLNSVINIWTKTTYLPIPGHQELNVSLLPNNDELSETGLATEFR